MVGRSGLWVDLWVQLVRGYRRGSNWFMGIGVVCGSMGIGLVCGYRCGCAVGISMAVSGFELVVLWFVGISMGQFV